MPPQGTTSLNNTGSSTASTGGSSGWMSHVLAFIRWKKAPRRKSKGHGREGKGAGAHDGGGATPGVTPSPGKGFSRKTRPLLPKQLPEFAGRKQVRSACGWHCSSLAGRISGVKGKSYSICNWVRILRLYRERLGKKVSAYPTVPPGELIVRRQDLYR